MSLTVGQRPINYLLSGLKRNLGVGTDGLVLKSVCRGFSSQHQYGGSKLPVTPIPGDPTSSSGFLRYQAYMWWTYIHAYMHTWQPLTHTHKIKSKKDKETSAVFF